MNDINGMHVRSEHLFAALNAAVDGAVAEGAVGSGTGMTCHGYKRGIGTASRRAGDRLVGVLVQANHGRAPGSRSTGCPSGASSAPKRSRCRVPARTRTAT